MNQNYPQAANSAKLPELLILDAVFWFVHGNESSDIGPLR
jgi:hypothetical protein